MGLIKEIVANEKEFVSWRHAMHRNPGLGFEESFASQLVEEKLREFGFDEVHTKIGKTGVVGVLRGKRQSDQAIGLRADMDALPIQEETGKLYASKTSNVMHACGHDGHTATLLAAAWYLSKMRDFSGTVYFIFQPAEEGLGGALAMLDDGLQERFPCDRLYAYHNMPGLKLGHFYTRKGSSMAGCTFFTIRINGRGGHAAMPHKTIDCAQIVGNIVITAQSIVARNIKPTAIGVVSFTDVYARTNSHNVIPDKATLKGCLRYFAKETGEQMKTRLAEIAQNVAVTYGGNAEIDYNDNFVPLLNDGTATDIAIQVATDLAGSDKVVTNMELVTGSEDFAYMIENNPGNYILIGGGEGAMPHHPKYDFNDALLVIGASYFCRLAETELA